MEIQATGKRRILMDTIIKYLTTKIVKPVLTVYLKKDRKYKYKNLELIILKGVFHPRFFFSSKYLASFIEKLNLEDKTFCEPCSGCGIIALSALNKKAKVTCFDIDRIAVENIKINYGNNKRIFNFPSFTVLESDLFDSIPKQTFNFIVINPPYFFSEVNNPEQLAWNAGKNGEFFIKFFSQLADYTDNNTEIYMILADNCEIAKIKQMAGNYNWNFALKEQKKILWETNYIYQILKQK